MTQNELFDTVNEFDVVVGKTTLSNIYSHNNYRVINAFIINSFGQLWIPRRSARKIIFPLCLDSSVGGHVIAGENYEQAFHREVKEELNLSTKDIPYKCIGYLTPPRHGVSAFMKVFELRTDIFPDYNSDEIASAQWLYPNQVLNSIHNGDGAKSDLEILIAGFYIRTSKDNIQNCRVYDLSNELPLTRSNNNWVYKYYSEWQKIKDIDHRERIKYHRPVAWAEYYSQKAEIAFGGYRNYHTRRMIENYPFYDLVLKELIDSKIALEIGLGAGTGLIELHKQGIRVVGLDKDQDILKLVDRHSDLDSTGLAHSSVRADLFSLPFSDREFDVCYSHGVFEHFSDHLIVTAIKEAVRVSRKLIFSIPTHLASISENRKRLRLSSNAIGGSNFGDERLLSIEHWENLINDNVNLEIKRKYGYWIPQLGSKTMHPEAPEAYYGLGIYAIYVL